jgi:hypothetical membrane protein
MYGYGYGSPSSYAAAGAFVMGTIILTVIMSIIGIVCVVLTLIGLWKTFEKLGLPGWEGLLIGHNLVCLFEKADIPKQYVFFYYIPYVGWLGANIYMGIQLMKKFGKGPGMGVVLGLFPPIGFMITGFSKNYVYQGAKVEAEAKVETTTTETNK